MKPRFGIQKRRCQEELNQTVEEAQQRKRSASLAHPDTFISDEDPLAGEEDGYGEYNCTIS